jgi:hypothetical protein
MRSSGVIKWTAPAALGKKLLAAIHSAQRVIKGHSIDDEGVLGVLSSHEL